MDSQLRTIVEMEDVLWLLCVVVRLWYGHLIVIVQSDERRCVVVVGAFVELFLTGVVNLFAGRRHRRFENIGFDSISLHRMHRTACLLRCEILLQIGRLNEERDMSVPPFAVRR